MSSSTNSGTPSLTLQTIAIASSDRLNSLWSQAASKLDRQISFGKSDKTEILGDVLKFSREKQDKATQQQWKITRRNGKVVYFRDIYGNIASSVKKFREIGDVAIQYDPGHAALPWAGVRLSIAKHDIEETNPVQIRLFLQLSINANERHVAILQGMELAADLITRSTIIERLYLSQSSIPSAPAQHLEQALLRLYIKILEFMADAIHYFDSNTLARLGKSLLQPAELSIQKQILEVVREQNHVDSSVQYAKAQLDQTRDAAVDAQFVTLRGLLAGMQSPAQDLYDQMTVIIDKLQHEEEKDFLDWLSSIPYSQYHDNIRKGRIADTGQWLRRKKAYTDWKDSSSSSMLWLHGIPGCGKSKLVSAVIDELEAQYSTQQPDIPIIYFYCARDAAEKKLADPDEAARSMVRQLCKYLAGTTSVQSVKELYRTAIARDLEAEKLDLPSCQRLISKMALQKTIFILVDALDECNSSRRHELMKLFENLVASPDSVVKILVSSRDDNDIGIRFRAGPNIPIHEADNAEDIQRYIREKVDEYVDDGRLLEGNISDDLKNDIIADLEAGAQGMFLWVSLQLENLSDPQRMFMEADVRAELQQLPETLTDLYAAACDQIDRAGPSARHIAITTLRWLLCAQRPMRTQEITGAVSVDHDGKVSPLTAEQVVATCRNIVVHDQDLDLLRFAHLSVRDYLEKRDGFTPTENESVVAERCLDVVSATYSPLPVPGQKLRQNLDVQAYATDYWPFHYRNIDPDQVSQRFEKKIFRFFFRGDRHSNAFTHWTVAFLHQCLSYADDPQISATSASILCDPPTPLFAACLFGFPKVVLHLSRINPTELTRCNTLGQSALSLASESGHFEIVRLLLRPSPSEVESVFPFPALAVQIEHSPEVVYYIAAIQAALASNQTDAVRMMLTRGKQRKDGTRLLDYALELAAWMGENDMVSLLLSHGSDVRYPRPGPKFHLIIQATLYGMQDLVERLFDNGVDPAMLSWDGRGMSILEYAALNDQPGIIRLAMDRGASVVTSNMAQQVTAFHDAAWRNHIACVQALFDGTVKQGGREEALELLNMKTTHKKETALHYACEQEHCEAANLLLDLGATVSRDKQGMSAFHRAAMNGQLGIVNIFLCKPQLGKVTRLRDHRSNTALHWASLQPHLQICEALLSHDAECLLLENNELDTPLHYAAMDGHMSVASLVIKAAEDQHHLSPLEWLDKKNKRQKTPLMEAATYGSPKAVKLLLDHGADPTIRASGPKLGGDDGEKYPFSGLDFTALHFAINYQQWACVEALISHCAANLSALQLSQWLCMKDATGQSALTQAREMDATACVDLLLRHGATEDSNGDRHNRQADSADQYVREHRDF